MSAEVKVRRYRVGPPRRERPQCLGTTECSCRSCLTAQVLRYAPHLIRGHR
jgi:hypothetical protein